MRWKGREQSDNIEDRRGMAPAGKVIGGGGLFTLVIALIVMFLGGDPAQVVSQLPQPGQATTLDQAKLDPEAKEFVSVVLKDTEDVWTKLFAEKGLAYQKPKLVLFSGQVESACGFASSAVGPFYCPGDNQVYLDTSFYDDLANRFGAPGEFAKAYVIAHEVGHHIQNLLGTSDQVDALRKRLSQTEFNKVSVRMELQADFLAGVWAHHTQRVKNVLNEQDIRDGLRAAERIGDDNLQMQAQGHVVPESFTHGTGEQRMRWFMKGFRTGDMTQGDTFNASQL